MELWEHNRVSWWGVSCNLLCVTLRTQGVCNGLAVATVSAPHHPPRLMLASVPAESSNGGWNWVPVTALDVDLSSLPLAADALSNMRCEVLDVKPTVGDDSLPMQAVVQVSRGIGWRWVG